MTIRVCVAGATGWAGGPLARAIARQPDLELVGAVSRSNAGRRLGDVLGVSGLEVAIQATVASALAVDTDVYVDYTRADVVRAHVFEAIARGMHVVVGASGLTGEDFDEVDRRARERSVGVVAAGNFALSAALLQRFACEAARYLSHWEIVDTASAGKVDAPSGTARELAYRLAEVRLQSADVSIADTVGERESRGATLDGTQVHSIRLAGYTIGVEALFGANDERLSIRFDAGPGAEPYVQGALLAIRKVSGHVGLVRGLDRVMEWNT
jgi:4-hydroxy-tetrahydrodipicolinate reductase